MIYCDLFLILKNTFCIFKRGSPNLYALNPTDLGSEDIHNFGKINLFPFSNKSVFWSHLSYDQFLKMANCTIMQALREPRAPPRPQALVSPARQDLGWHPWVLTGASPLHAQAGPTEG